MSEYRRRSIRLRGYDYSQEGFYFVTICTQDRAHLFGEIDNTRMILNEFGNIANNKWIETSQIRKNIKLDAHIVMPNHIHGIINVGAYCNTPLPKTPVPKTPIQCGFISTSQTIGAIIRGYKSSVTNKINQMRKTPQCPVWQRNYYEHIIRNENEYYAIRQYIKNNVVNWEKDTLYI